MKHMMMLHAAHRIIAILLNLIKMLNDKPFKQVDQLILRHMASRPNVVPVIALTKKLPGKSPARLEHLLDPLPQRLKSLRIAERQRKTRIHQINHPRVLSFRRQQFHHSLPHNAPVAILRRNLSLGSLNRLRMSIYR